VLAQKIYKVITAKLNINADQPDWSMFIDILKVLKFTNRKNDLAKTNNKLVSD
jgi:hypothetical protein